jgi:hypothetical protein
MGSPHIAGEYVLSTALLKDSRSRQTREQKLELEGSRINVRSYAAAEKGDEGMALKILIRAEDMVDAKENLESHAHTKWRRAIRIDIRNYGKADISEEPEFSS